MIGELGNALSLDLKLVIIGIAVAIGVTNALKKFSKGKLRGYVNLIPVGGCALILGFLFGMPDAMSVLAYVFIIFIGAVIGWETVKIAMHKSAEPKAKD